MGSIEPGVEVTSEIIDAVIVGAGFSGLAAANSLVRAGKSVVVLEALDRVGGKVYDRKFPNGCIVEAGAEFVGPCQDRVLQLAKELGIDTFETYATGRSIFHSRGKTIAYDPAVAGVPIEEAGLLQLATANQNLNQMAQELDAIAPWKHSNAHMWDKGTMASWLDSNVQHPEARDLLNLTIKTLLSSDPADISLLQVLTYIRRAGNENTVGDLRRLISVAEGAQERRFVGGPQLIAVRLAERLGDVVQLCSPVRTIRKLSGIYHVSGDHFSVLARHVILALSPPLAARINFQPPLPSRRDQLSQHMPMGSLGKVLAMYKTPFWRDEGLSGMAIGLNGTEVQATFDSSPKDASCGILLGFLEANEMRHFDSKSEEDIQVAVVEDFVKFFGSKARDVESWVIQRWDNEEFARGGHFAVCPPNVMTQYGAAITEPVGHIYFAGTEASPYWSGFMDGAIRAGEIAASQICSATKTNGIQGRL
jgi:monoamine oxidase